MDITTIIIGLVPVTILAVVVYFAAKKDSAKLEDMLAEMSEDKKQQLRDQEYVKSILGKKMYETKGYVAQIQDLGERSKVHILFYNELRRDFYDQPTKVNNSDLEPKGIRTGAFIDCNMKYDEEYQIYQFKSIK